MIPLPVPASIYGLILLLIALMTGIVKLHHIKETGQFLIDIMPIMFIPAGVGLITSWGVLKAQIIPTHTKMITKVVRITGPVFSSSSVNSASLAANSFAFFLASFFCAFEDGVFYKMSYASVPALFIPRAASDAQCAICHGRTAFPYGILQSAIRFSAYHYLCDEIFLMSSSRKPTPSFLVSL